MRGICGQPLDGGDQFALGCEDRIRTGANWLSVDVNGTGTALGDTAGKLGAFQVEDVLITQSKAFPVRHPLISTVVDVQFHNGFPE